MFINLNFQIFGLDLYFKMGYTKRNRTNVREKGADNGNTAGHDHFVK